MRKTDGIRNAQKRVQHISTGNWFRTQSISVACRKTHTLLIGARKLDRQTQFEVIGSAQSASIGCELQ
jgi:hypothetical protein